MCQTLFQVLERVMEDTEKDLLSWSLNFKLLRGWHGRIAWGQAFETSQGNIVRPCLYKKKEKYFSGPQRWWRRSMNSEQINEPNSLLINVRRKIEEDPWRRVTGGGDEWLCARHHQGGNFLADMRSTQGKKVHGASRNVLLFSTSSEAENSYPSWALRDSPFAYGSQCDRDLCCRSTSGC